MQPINLRDHIRAVPGFPKPGITFRDIGPLLGSPQAFQHAVNQLGDGHEPFDMVAALDARGFLFGAPLALALNLPFAMVRKAGKLPGDTIRLAYSLEYGEAEIEIDPRAVPSGARVLLVDDVLATGGTMKAACKLIEQVGGIVAGCAFVIELEGLGGREALDGYPIQSQLKY